MLKQVTLHSPSPKHAKTRSFPRFVLGSKKSSTYPQGYASGFSALRPRWLTRLSIR
jgi:hypothetical protein